MIASLDEKGFALIEHVLSAERLETLCAAMEQAGRNGAGRGDVHGLRNILSSVPEIQDLCRSPEIRALLSAFPGDEYFPVRGIFFDKPFRANWLVYWHQDLTIAVNEKRELPGFGPWTRKAGITHVQPPAKVLQDMITLRIHLDDCSESNGALRVMPGSHSKGILKADEIKDLMARESPKEIICEIPAGGVLVMRPMILHSSRSSAQAIQTGARRRVIHIEFARSELPGGLEWHARS